MLRVRNTVSATKGAVPRQARLGGWGRFRSAVGPREVLPVSCTRQFPGEQSLRLREKLSCLQAGTTVDFGVQYEKCEGKYIVDGDGNRLLDLFMQIASLPQGYNHACFEDLFSDPRFRAWSVSRPALGLFPPAEWQSELESSLLADEARPGGLHNVITFACGSCSVENAVKLACIYNNWFAKSNGDESFVETFSDEEQTSTMINAMPGSSNNLVVLSFKGGFHGRTLGALSCTRSKPIHKMGIPSFEHFPVADFPQLRYPLPQNAEWNALEEQRCLEDVKQQFRDQKHRGHKIACVLVEPILSEGGDLHASVGFFRQLRKFISEQPDHPGCLMIVDEVQTGLGATGKMWAHSHWYDNGGANLERPDIVTFSKKALTGGFYYNGEKLNPSMRLPYRIFNTWMGDPCKVAMLAKVIREIRSEDLLAGVQEVGEALQSVLHAAAQEHPHLVQNVRGVGTLCAFDVPDGKAPELVNRVRRNGVLVGMSGTSSVRFRPSLTLSLEHVKQFELVLGRAIAELSTTWQQMGVSTSESRRDTHAK